MNATICTHKRSDHAYVSADILCARSLGLGFYLLSVVITTPLRLDGD